MHSYSGDELHYTTQYLDLSWIFVAEPSKCLIGPDDGDYRVQSLPYPIRRELPKAGDKGDALEKCFWPAGREQFLRKMA